jgi:hypothetical protein
MAVNLLTGRRFGNVGLNEYLQACSFLTGSRQSMHNIPAARSQLPELATFMDANPFVDEQQWTSLESKVREKFGTSVKMKGRVRGGAGYFIASL